MLLVSFLNLLPSFQIRNYSVWVFTFFWKRSRSGTLGPGCPGSTAGWHCPFLKTSHAACSPPHPAQHFCPAPVHAYPHAADLSTHGSFQSFLMAELAHPLGFAPQSPACFSTFDLCSLDWLFSPLPLKPLPPLSLLPKLHPSLLLPPCTSRHLDQ